MANRNFFDESLEQSQIKTAIVADYFWTWANIILATAKKHHHWQEIAYIDLFSGPGRYGDKTESTPIQILERAVSDPDLRNALVTVFNDKDTQKVASLKSEIAAIRNIQLLKHQPQVFSSEVGEEIAQAFERVKLIPTLFFVDPWGYKGLSLRLINSVLQNWGCDCIFFFNYNRINMGLENQAVEEHMNALFGKERADQLRQKLEPLSPYERELVIVEELAQALKAMGGKYVLPFRFKNARGQRTSHHLIFVSKNFKGYEVMKSVMAKHSSIEEQGVPSFEYDPASIHQPLLFAFRPRPIDDLKESLLVYFAGQELSFRQVYERHSVDTPFLEKNYRDALRQLENEGRITAVSSNPKRRAGTFAEHVRIKFPL